MDGMVGVSSPSLTSLAPEPASQQFHGAGNFGRTIDSVSGSGKVTHVPPTTQPRVQPAKGKTMNANETETKSPLQHVEDNMARRIRFALEGWEEQAAKAREAVAQNSNSDWALMEDLAKAYGYAPVAHAITRHLEYVENGHATWLDGMTKLRDSFLGDLVRSRVSNSTSAAANLISQYKLQATQAAFELVDGWVTVLKAAQPVPA